MTQQEHAEVSHILFPFSCFYVEGGILCSLGDHSLQELMATSVCMKMCLWSTYEINVTWVDRFIEREMGERERILVEPFMKKVRATVSVKPLSVWTTQKMHFLVYNFFFYSCVLAMPLFDSSFFFSSHVGLPFFSRRAEGSCFSLLKARRGNVFTRPSSGAFLLSKAELETGVCDIPILSPGSGSLFFL